MPSATIVTYGARGTVGRLWLLDSFCIQDVLEDLTFSAQMHLDAQIARCHGDGVSEECKQLLLAYPGASSIIQRLSDHILNNAAQLEQQHFAYLIQCQAGVSRSVALAQLISDYIMAANPEWRVFTIHLDAKKRYTRDTTFVGIDIVKNLCQDDYEEILEIPMVNTIRRFRELRGIQAQ